MNPSPSVGRRPALLGLIALFAGARAARGDDAPGAGGLAHEIKTFSVARPGVPARKFSILVPRHLKKGDEVGLVVALHGLGETHDEDLGARAWLDLYGLAGAYRRIHAPPIARTSLRKDFEEERLREINAALARDPFRGLCVACPFTPNPKKLKDRAKDMAAYAAWLEDVVAVEARRHAPIRKGREATALVGCSMGATVALEVIATRPATYGGIGFVQGALSREGAKRNAERIAAAAKAGAFDVELLTSKGDPFLDGHRALAGELAARKIDHDLRVLPGPHDQPWLREAGSIEMLFYQGKKRG